MRFSKSKLPGPLLLIVAVIFFFGSMSVRAAEPEERLKAPDFTGAAGWINTDKPISIKDLKGQVVLLDFWTYCCINCMHIFPDLAFLEEKYKDQPFVVIGVHSGKFDQEKDSEHIRNAVLRHNIAHPVAVDSEYKIWNEYGVRSWPTLVLIDADGNAVQAFSGEGHRAQLDKAIEGLLAAQKAKGPLAKPLTFKRERENFSPGVLEFPGKVLADAKGSRLFIADTNHHRVLVCDLRGKVSDVIGKGEIGLKDGGFNDALFHQPQGMALSADGKTFYVADTENHAVRAIDLQSKTVKTLAGTGKQARDRNPDGPGKTTDLSSPWDVVLIGDTLYVAMAGTHQIWTIDLKKDRVLLHAGTGRESAATDGTVIYVADSEASTIRAVDAAPEGKTTSVAGSNELFTFGLTDGVGPDARFQHPLGVALAPDGALFVADTFNGVIRRIDLKSRAVERWLGTGKSAPGETAADKIGFYEPGGLSVTEDTLYVADTNHHRIVAVNLKTKTPTVMKIELPK